MNTASLAVGPGRPKDLEKRSAMLDAAKVLFLRHGFEGTSMDAIAQRAGVSKLTVYSHFKNKDGLFREVVLAKCRDHAPFAMCRETCTGLRETLRFFAFNILDLVFSDEAVQLYRVIMAEARHNAKLGRLFYEVGPEPTVRHFESLLREWSDCSLLQVDDVHRAATEFFCLLKGEHHLRLLIGVAAAPSGDVLEKHVTRCVDAFLQLYPPND